MLRRRKGTLFDRGCAQQMLHPDDRKRLQSVKKMKELKCFEELNWADVEQGKATPSFIPPVCSVMHVCKLGTISPAISLATSRQEQS